MVVNKVEEFGFWRTYNISRERELVENLFPFITCSVVSNELKCLGYFQPTNKRYEYLIRFDGENPPVVNVINPIIHYDERIHMYFFNNSLCLYYPPDEPWNPMIGGWLCNKLIPWTHEWFVFYEKFLISGIWEHPQVNHFKI